MCWMVCQQISYKFAEPKVSNRRGVEHNRQQRARHNRQTDSQKDTATVSTASRTDFGDLKTLELSDNAIYSQVLNLRE